MILFAVKVNNTAVNENQVILEFLCMFRVKKQRRPACLPKEEGRSQMGTLCFKFSASSRKLLVLPFDYNLHLDWLPEGESLAKGDGAVWLESLADLAGSNGIYIKTIISLIGKHERHPFHLIF